MKDLISIILALIIVMFLAPLIIMWLWNWAIVGAFALPKIEYWTAFAMRWIMRLLVNTKIYKGDK